MDLFRTCLFLAALTCTVANEGTVTFYAKEGLEEQLCSVQWAEGSFDKYHDYKASFTFFGDPCPNDVVNSMLIDKAEVGTKFYIHVDGSSALQLGSSAITVYKTIDETTGSQPLNGFNEYFKNDFIENIPYNGGLGQGVSRFVVEEMLAPYSEEVVSGTLEFYSENFQGGDLLCVLEWTIDDTANGYDIKLDLNDPEQAKICPANKGKSMIIRNAGAGTRIELYLDPVGRTNKDNTQFLIKESVTDVKINTFAQTVITPSINQINGGHGGGQDDPVTIDGNISWIVLKLPFPY